MSDGETRNTVRERSDEKMSQSMKAIRGKRKDDGRIKINVRRPDPNTGYSMYRMYSTIKADGRNSFDCFKPFFRFSRFRRTLRVRQTQKIENRKVKGEGRILVLAAVNPNKKYNDDETWDVRYSLRIRFTLLKRKHSVKEERI
jgi:hypothetical protein